MKNIKLLLVFLIVGLSSYAQSNQKKIYKSESGGVVIILNDEIISSFELLSSIPNNQIQELKFQPKKNIFFHHKDKTGIITVKTEFNFETETKTQTELNNFLGLDPNTNLYINGILLESKNYLISSNGITKIEILEPDNLFFNEPVVNITIK